MRTLWLFGPPIAWCIAIFCLSAQPDLPSTPGGDKTAHLVAYAIGAALIARAFWFGTAWSDRAVFVAAALAAILYGASDELHQRFVPGREASFADLAADAAGAVLSVLTFYLVARFTTWVRRDTAGPWPDTRSRSS